MQSIVVFGRISLMNEIKEFEEGKKKLLTFSVGDSYMKQVTYFNCQAWNNVATNIKKFFKVGDTIALKLRYTTDTYTDNNGNKKNKSYFIVETFNFFGKKEKTEEIDNNVNSDIFVDEDELPF